MPSVADLAEAEIRPYRKVCSEEEYRELTRAVGLASHGVGIGSFVYLRRIFERLIEEAKTRAKAKPDWDESVFARARMDEKIALLKGELPEFLVEQRSLYSILSKGIHSLTEQECLNAFPVVRAAIELILDDKISSKLRAEKIAEARKQIQVISVALSEDREKKNDPGEG